MATQGLANVTPSLKKKSLCPKQKLLWRGVGGILRHTVVNASQLHCSFYGPRKATDRLLSSTEPLWQLVANSSLWGTGEWKGSHSCVV